MTKGRLAAGLGLTLLLLGCVAVGWTWRSEPISPAGYDRIRLGMTPHEVDAALGLSAGDYYTRHAVYGTMSRPLVEPLRERGLPFRDFDDAISGRGTGRRDIRPGMWCGNAYCIWVRFDESGSSVGAYLLKVESGRDSALTKFLDGVRFRLGL
jgi:hypothetical protein